MEKIIAVKLKSLERIYRLLDSPTLHSLSIPEHSHAKIAIALLQQAMRLVRDTQTLLLAINYPAEPVFLSLLDGALREMQACLKQWQNSTRNQQEMLSTGADYSCAREAVFSGIIALQLFIAP